MTLYYVMKSDKKMLSFEGTWHINIWQEKGQKCQSLFALTLHAPNSDSLSHILPCRHHIRRKNRFSLECAL